MSTVNLNGATSSYVVNTEHVLQISVFDVAAGYIMDSERLGFATIVYQVDNLYKPTADAELVLKVILDGELLEEVSLLSTSQLATGETMGGLGYMPVQGWESGTYTFQADLYVDGELYTSTTEQDLEVTPESAVAVFGWAALGAIISAALLLAAVTIPLLIRRRRLMLGARRIR